MGKHGQEWPEPDKTFSFQDVGPFCHHRLKKTCRRIYAKSCCRSFQIQSHRSGRFSGRLPAGLPFFSLLHGASCTFPVLSGPGIHDTVPVQTPFSPFLRLFPPVQSKQSPHGMGPVRSQISKCLLHSGASSILLHSISDPGLEPVPASSVLPSGCVPFLHRSGLPGRHSDSGYQKKTLSS